MFCRPEPKSTICVCINEYIYIYTSGNTILMALFGASRLCHASLQTSRPLTSAASEYHPPGRPFLEGYPNNVPGKSKDVIRLTNVNIYMKNIMYLI